MMTQDRKFIKLFSDKKSGARAASPMRDR